MSVDGTWNLSLNTPMAAQQGTLEIKMNGDSLEGTMTGPQDVVPLEDGKIYGDSITWSITAQQMALLCLITRAITAIVGIRISIR
jgi:hypothetical protein